MKPLAASLASESIRVNSVHPTGVKSGMTVNEAMGRLVAQAMEGADTSISAMQNAMPIEILEPEDVADTVAFLVSDQAKWITGVACRWTLASASDEPGAWDLPGGEELSFRWGGPIPKRLRAVRRVAGRTPGLVGR